ncbi:uncharacterized protein A4U43_C04F8150 [Asparagus officinalis]|uniref:Amidase domain-containing protein n=1 Tax=Asparagus officinalis TaxID=4686 RepID=A0A5P1F3N3_ASPOF|nr:uncharacterized protein A4U43_C04F8150 [Asparagus officinalis]
MEIVLLFIFHPLSPLSSCVADTRCLPSVPHPGPGLRPQSLRPRPPTGPTPARAHQPATYPPANPSTSPRPTLLSSASLFASPSGKYSAVLLKTAPPPAGGSRTTSCYIPNLRHRAPPPCGMSSAPHQQPQALLPRLLRRRPPPSRRQRLAVDTRATADENALQEGGARRRGRHRIRDRFVDLDFIELNPNALAQADRADWERKHGHGPCKGLHGIPVMVQDNIATKDRLNTTVGSLALLGSVVPRDAGVVRRLRRTGAVILGKASLSEWSSFRSFKPVNGWSARGRQGRVS